MRVALISEFFYPTLGGIQDHLFFFARELLRRGHEPTIITPRILSGGEFHNWWPRDLPKKVYKPVGWSLPFFINGSLGRTSVGIGLGTSLGRLLRPKNFDIVHLHSPLNGTLPILALQRSSVPVVGTFHTSFAGSKLMSALKPIAQKQIDALDRIIAVSPIALHSIRNIFPELDASLVSNGVDTNYFRPVWEGADDRLPEYRDGKVNIFFIGRPDPRNGLDALIRAYSRIHKKFPNTRLIIAGDGELMGRYRKMVDLLLPDGGAEFLGSVRDERPQLYRSSDIHVFGVERATFSITVLEGMASGVAVVTTNFEGHEFIGNAGEHFLTFPFDNDQALEERLAELIVDKEKRETLGRAARKHVLSYDWKNVAERVIEIYKEVLSKA